MTVYAGLDVSLNETSVCVVDAEGTVVQECRVPSEPDAIDQALRAHLAQLGRVGIEASSLGAWLQIELSMPRVRGDRDRVTPYARFTVDDAQQD